MKGRVFLQKTSKRFSIGSTRSDHRVVSSAATRAWDFPSRGKLFNAPEDEFGRKIVLDPLRVQARASSWSFRWPESSNGVLRQRARDVHSYGLGRRSFWRPFSSGRPAGGPKRLWQV